MKRVIVTGTLPAEVEQALAQRYDVDRVELRSVGIEGFLSAIGAPDGVVVQPGDPVNAELIGRLPQSVRVIASYSVGLDHVDLDAAAARGLPVTNTPDVLTEATADVAMLLILGTLRGASPAAAMLREGRWAGWQPAQVFGSDLTGRTLGIFGAGRIGTATAARAKAFGMRLIYWSGRGASGPLDGLGAESLPDLDAFLGRSEVLSLHAPSNDDTRGFVNAATIEKLPKGAIIINTARGDLLNDSDVIAAARSGRLAGVGLDVFAGEPDLDRGYLDLPNAFLLPHIGSATTETRAAMGQKVIEGLGRHLN